VFQELFVGSMGVEADEVVVPVSVDKSTNSPNNMEISAAFAVDEPGHLKAPLAANRPLSSR
jgi:hypothetical protein